MYDLFIRNQKISRNKAQNITYKQKKMNKAQKKNIINIHYSEEHIEKNIKKLSFLFFIFVFEYDDLKKVYMHTYTYVFMSLKNI